MNPVHPQPREIKKAITRFGSGSISDARPQIHKTGARAHVTLCGTVSGRAGSSVRRRPCSELLCHR
jgi:hypothetical protein